MIKIKVCQTDAHGACSYYRGMGVIPKLRYLNPDIQVEMITQVAWYNIADADIIYFVRPWDDAICKAMDMIKDFKIKIWTDLDDLVHEIPTQNPAYAFFAGTTAKNNLEKALKMSDVVTVATPHLAKFYKKFNENIHVVPNAHNDYNYPWEMKMIPQEKLISWRGSPTHRGDLLSVAKGIFETAQKNECWAWCFIGNDIWYITENMKNCLNIPEKDIISYYKFIREINPAIQIVPLQFNDFNRAKSNIGYIEGTYAGAATLAPHLPEFSRPGCVTYEDTVGSFEYNLEKLINSENMRKKNYKDSFHYIKKNLLLSDINQKRIKIIKSLI